MKDGGTELGGPQGRFPSTIPGLLSAFHGRNLQAREESFDLLARRYWKPVYCFFRAGGLRGNEDSKDMTQAFFLWLFEGDALERYDASRGSFRNFLKGVLKNFSVNRVRADQAIKRGGAARRVAFDEKMDDLVPVEQDPSRAFDRAWKNDLLQRAVARVGGESRSGLSEIQFRVFEAYDLAGEQPTYAQVAEKLGLKESDVRNHLSAVREHVRAAVREELAETTTDPASLKEEWDAFVSE